MLFLVWMVSDNQCLCDRRYFSGSETHGLTYTRTVCLSVLMRWKGSITDKIYMLWEFTRLVCNTARYFLFYHRNKFFLLPRVFSWSFWTLGPKKFAEGVCPPEKRETVWEMFSRSGGTMIYMCETVLVLFVSFIILGQNRSWDNRSLIMRNTHMFRNSPQQNWTEKKSSQRI